MGTRKKKPSIQSLMQKAAEANFIAKPRAAKKRTKPAAKRETPPLNQRMQLAQTVANTEQLATRIPIETGERIRKWVAGQMLEGQRVRITWIVDEALRDWLDNHGG